MGLAQRRNSSPGISHAKLKKKKSYVQYGRQLGGTTDTTSDTETVDVYSRRSSLVSHIEYHQQVTNRQLVFMIFLVRMFREQTVSAASTA